MRRLLALVYLLVCYAVMLLPAISVDSSAASGRQAEHFNGGTAP